MEQSLVGGVGCAVWGVGWGVGERGVGGGGSGGGGAIFKVVSASHLKNGNP